MAQGLTQQDVQRQAAELETEIVQLRKAQEEVRTQKWELERRVTERNAQLEAANDELEAFSHSISHDLRAPLRHVLAFISAAMENAEDGLPASARSDLETALGAARRMEKLISDLVTFYRISQAEMHVRPINLNVLLPEIIRGFASETQNRDIEWQLHRLPDVSGDSELLRQVFVNLIANAIKFTGPRPHARIEVGVQPAESDVVIFIRDNGVGFDMQYAHRLFGVFQRMHSAERFPGSGIGLATVRRIVHRHGGHVWAEGRSEEGATFYFALPRIRPA